MNFTSIALSFLLVGAPVFSGTYLVVRHFGERRVSSGVSLLIFGLAVGGAIIYYQPEGRLSQGDYLFTTPSVLIGGIVLGAIVGLAKRRGKK